MNSLFHKIFVLSCSVSVAFLLSMSTSNIWACSLAISTGGTVTTGAPKTFNWSACGSGTTKYELWDWTAYTKKTLTGTPPANQTTWTVTKNLGLHYRTYMVMALRNQIDYWGPPKTFACDDPNGSSSPNC